FLQSTNLFFICLNVGEIAIMALPLTLLVVTGEIDLSVASMLGLAGVLMAELFKHGWPIWPAMIAAVVLGAILGAANGFLVTRIGLPSLAVTIGTLTLYRGIAQGILPTDTIGGFPTNLTNIGVIPIPGTHFPYSIAFFALLAIVFAVVLHATPLGRAIFAIGAGQEAAFFAGIRVKRIKFWLFVLSGTLSGFAGVLWSLRFASARYDSGVGMELFVVTIVLLGGVSMAINAESRRVSRRWAQRSSRPASWIRRKPRGRPARRLPRHASTSSCSTRRPMRRRRMCFRSCRPSMRRSSSSIFSRRARS